MELYYDGPMQLMFIRPATNEYHYGIGCHEFIIDVHDGMIFSTKQIIDCANIDPDEAIIEYGDWKDLSKDFDKL